MATCPSCGSKRLGEGYRTAPLPMRIVGIRTLLCDNCNFEFRAFSPLPPKRPKSRRSKRKADVFNAGPAVDLKALAPAGSDAVTQRQLPAAPFDRAALPVYQSAEVPIDANSGLPINFEDDLPSATTHRRPEQARVVSVSMSSAGQPVKAAPAPVIPVQAPVPAQAQVAVPEPLRQLREQITVPPPKISTEAPIMHLKEELEERRSHSALGQQCPKCASTEIKRRHRKALERMMLGLTNFRPFSCLRCGHDFYARRKEQPQSLITKKEAEFVKDSCFNQAEKPELPLAKTE